MPYPDPESPTGPSPNGRSDNSKSPGLLLRLLFAGIALLTGWEAAAAVFRSSFNSHDNHDSAAPLLLATPIALGAFVVVATVAFIALNLLWRRLRGSGGR